MFKLYVEKDYIFDKVCIFGIKCKVDLEYSSDTLTTKNLKEVKK